MLQIGLSGEGTRLLIQSKFMTDYVENFVLNLSRLLVSVWFLLENFNAHQYQS